MILSSTVIDRSSTGTCMYINMRVWQPDVRQPRPNPLSQDTQPKPILNTLKGQLLSWRLVDVPSDERPRDRSLITCRVYRTWSLTRRQHCTILFTISGHCSRSAHSNKSARHLTCKSLQSPWQPASCHPDNRACALEGQNFLNLSIKGDYCVKPTGSIPNKLEVTGFTSTQ